MKTVRRPPYPKWNPCYFPCSSLTPLPLSSRRPSVSFGGFGFTRLEELSCGVRRPTTTLHRTCTPARVRKTFKPTPARSNVTGAAYSTKTAPNTVGITEHKRQRLAGISHLGLLGLRISPMPAADASTSVAMLRRFISAVGRTSRETKRPTLTASASAPLPTSVNCSKCLINLANVIQPVQIYYGC